MVNNNGIWWTNNEYCYTEKHLKLIRSYIFIWWTHTQAIKRFNVLYILKCLLSLIFIVHKIKILQSNQVQHNNRILRNDELFTTHSDYNTKVEKNSIKDIAKSWIIRKDWSFVLRTFDQEFITQQSKQAIQKYKNYAENNEVHNEQLQNSFV